MYAKILAQTASLLFLEWGLSSALGWALFTFEGLFSFNKNYTGLHFYGSL